MDFCITDFELIKKAKEVSEFGKYAILKSATVRAESHISGGNVGEAVCFHLLNASVKFNIAYASEPKALSGWSFSLH